MEKVLESGARLRITVASFNIGKRLAQAVSKELMKVDVSFGLGKGKIEEFFNLDVDRDQAINTIKNLVFVLVSSPEIETILWECMERCTYQPLGADIGPKIEPKTFEDEKSRGDYFIVVKEVLVTNLRPFFPNLVSQFSIGLQKLTKPQATK